jgi:hypothetical protein
METFACYGFRTVFTQQQIVDLVLMVEGCSVCPLGYSESGQAGLEWDTWCDSFRVSFSTNSRCIGMP